MQPAAEYFDATREVLKYYKDAYESKKRWAR